MTQQETKTAPADAAHAILRQIVEAKGGAERPGQVLMAGVIAEHMTNMTPAILEGGTGIGKALALDTPILTTEGFVPMGEITTSHKVFVEDGTAAPVSKVYAVRRNRPCYKVTFSDGSFHVADGGHEYNTLSQSARRLAGRDDDAPIDPWLYTRTHTVEKMAQKLSTSGIANHQIPLADAIDETAFTLDSEVTVDPYIVGLWLYGTHRVDALGRNCVRLPTSPDFDVPGLSVVSATLVAPTQDTLDALDALGLEESWRVPAAYLFASHAERLSLLAGIADACAVASKPARSRGQVRIEHHDHGLLTDAQTLLATFAVRASLAGASVGAHGNRPGYVSYTPLHNPYRHAAKKRAVLSHLDGVTDLVVPWRSRRRSIVSIERVASVPVRCIEVDSPRHLYLAGTSLIPTHNSIGYLAGALAFAGLKAQRTRQPCSVVVAPHTKALQDQLVKDLDLIASSYKPGAGTPLRHAPTHTVIKGRSSYLCLRKLNIDEPADEDAGLFDPDTGEVSGEVEATGVGAEVVAIRKWAENTETGDRSELDVPVSNRAWRAVSSTADECTGSRCPFADDCYSNAVRDAAADADIIVVNQAYLATAMALDDLLPETVQGVIVDEAHEFASVVGDVFGSTVSRGRIEHVMKNMKKFTDRSSRVEKAVEAIGEACVRFDALPALAGKDADRTYPTLPPVTSLFEVIVERLRALRDGVGSLGATNEDDKALQEAAKREVDNLVSDVELILAGNTDTQAVWAEPSQRNDGELMFNAATFDPAPLIFDKLLRRYKSVVFTSATMSSDPHNFDQVAQDLGFGRENSPWRWNTVPSPFDYAKQGMLYFPETMPDPSVRTPEGRREYLEAVGEVARKAIAAADGRALVLCSSRESVRIVSEYLDGVLDTSRNPLLVQDSDSSTKHLAQEFANNPHAVLVGTRSFWTGVSFEGDTCAVTIIDKLPFPPPSDPIIAARTDVANAREHMGGFRRVSLPEATRMIVQGVGRQIRTVNDRGVVIVCDPRLNPYGRQSKRYARDIMKALPPFARAASWQDAEAFLKHINETASDRDNGVVVENIPAGDGESAEARDE